MDTLGGVWCNSDPLRMQFTKHVEEMYTLYNKEVLCRRKQGYPGTTNYVLSSDIHQSFYCMLTVKLISRVDMRLYICLNNLF